ncbi:hypothetical protein [Asticcacaulis sp. YBE204]|uniref:hypothetical protein n=1 Tax=Asticcacaulis sp. YBE204 TaxID=1282363 RepID=UPI0003C3DA26|nr:hypothetical protein [Asticcacaulis sp. YBE204]ESQ77813.1 hypothetical protein AEYBE204_16925 [Asticcacaulis sp. YBE204]
MRVLWIAAVVANLAIAGAAGAQSSIYSGGDTTYRPQDYRFNASADDGRYRDPAPSVRSQITDRKLHDLMSRAQTAFKKARTQREKGNAEAACRSMRQAIDLEKQYVSRKNTLYPELIRDTRPGLYEDLETEFCASVRS